MSIVCLEWGPEMNFQQRARWLGLGHACWSGMGDTREIREFIPSDPLASRSTDQRLAGSHRMSSVCDTAQ